MVFKIRRTSLWNDDKPHDLAFKCNFPQWDVRTTTEEDFNNRIRLFSRGDGALPWKEYGRNHEVMPNGHIRRQLQDKEEWAIDIASLDDLLKLAEKNEIIVSMGEMPSVEIYDDYRE